MDLKVSFFLLSQFNCKSARSSVIKNVKLQCYIAFKPKHIQMTFRRLNTRLDFRRSLGSDLCSSEEERRLITRTVAGARVLVSKIY